MGLVEQSVLVESLPWREVGETLSKTRPFAEVPADGIYGIDSVDRAGPRPAQSWSSPDRRPCTTGSVSREKPARIALSPMERQRLSVWNIRAMVTVKLPFLLATVSLFLLTAVQDSVLARFSGEQFWALMACCPSTRQVVPHQSGRKGSQRYQLFAVQRFRLICVQTHRHIREHDFAR